VSKWDDHDLTARVTNILDGVLYHNPEHHFGRPYVTPYQLAIALDQQHPGIRENLDLPLGGLGTAQQTSFAQYLAGELSRRIQAGEIEHIEGAFISNRHLVDIVFDHAGLEVRSSLTQSQLDLTMFRLHE
jgi:hypothetical protein